MNLLKTTQVNILRLVNFSNMIKKVYQQPTNIVLVVKRVISDKISNRMGMTAIFVILRCFRFGNMP